MEGSLEDKASYQAGHENVVTSPISNETLLVKERGSIEKRRVPKLLLKIPVCEPLHNLLVAPLLEQGGLPLSRDDDGVTLVGNTTIRQKDLPQLHRMSLRHKQVCGFKICISMHSIQKSLSAFRHQFVRTLTDARMLQSTTMELQTYIDTGLPCLVVATCEYPHWRCVLQRCGHLP
jgi:hypothetical protein